jgi:ADP-ribosylglycohydrolase
LFYRNDPNLLLEMVACDSRITHRSKEAVEGAKAIALAIALLATGGSKKELVGLVPDYLAECEVKRGIRKVEFYQEAGGIGIVEVLYLLGTKAHVVQTVPSAIAAFVLTNSYQEAVECAIRAGGDTDTTAAIAGALAGTYYGLNGVPAQYLAKLESANTILDLDQKLKNRRAPVKIAV